MALTIDWVSKIITVPQTDLTLVSGTLYNHDTNAFRLAVKALEASEEGITQSDILSHNTSYTVAGTTYARKIEIINGYSVKYEDGLYSVILSGSNNNIFDIQNGVLIQNTVQVIPTNSAGLQIVTQGSGVQAQDVTDIANAVWNTPKSNLTTVGSIGEFINKKMLTIALFLGLK